MAKEKIKYSTVTGKIANLNSGKNTIKVEIERKIRHPKYEKLIKLHKTFLVHLEEKDKEQYTLGAEVKIKQTKPLSAKKRWIVVPNKK